MDKKMIGMIVPTMDNSFFSNLAVEVERVMASNGFRTLLVSCDNDADREKEYFKLLEEMGVRGIVCVSGLSELPEGLVSDSMPLVWVDRVPVSQRRIPWVANDDAKAMEMAVDHLIERGSRNILLLPGFQAEMQENPRVRGYKNALRKHGLAFCKKYVLNRSGRGSSEEETGHLIRRMFLSDASVDGIITSSDRAAFGAVTALQSIGYFVPEDVRLISFDNSAYSAMGSPSVTSLDRKTNVLAQKTCEILEKLIRHESGVEIENTVTVSLKKRNSTR